MIAALHMILNSAAKYDCEEKVLSLELQQLGLPKDSCNAICRSYRGACVKLREHLAATVLQVRPPTIARVFLTSFSNSHSSLPSRLCSQLPRLERVDWRVDHVMRSGVARELNEPSVRLRLHASQPLTSDSSASSSQGLELSADQFRVFVSELKAARVLMENVA